MLQKTILPKKKKKQGVTKKMSNNPKHKNVSVKCLAKTRRQGTCQTPPVTGKKRCRMHGGAKGTGAPKGNKNAFKNGYNKEIIANSKSAIAIIKQWKIFMQDMN